MRKTLMILLQAMLSNSFSEFHFFTLLKQEPHICEISLTYRIHSCSYHIASLSPSVINKFSCHGLHMNLHHPSLEGINLIISSWC
mmetsp:Transcript_22725/g.32064  ORF Transcript_22725/g.32064 Transcript_22725/m.32064 type:complete len:85 (+) Transcript_22725:1554-1808(+)